MARVDVPTHANCEAPNKAVHSLLCFLLLIVTGMIIRKFLTLFVNDNLLPKAWLGEEPWPQHNVPLKWPLGCLCRFN